MQDGPLRRILRGQNVSSEPTPPDSVLAAYLEKLQGALQDEKSAIDMYRSLSDFASNFGYQDDVEYLREILHDEGVHYDVLSRLRRHVENELRKRGWKI